VLNLIDFGAGREFETDFLGSYLEIIHGAYSSNKEKIMENSLKMGFLTGEENREMAEAHHTGVMIVGEPFRTSHPDEPYDFAGAGFTKKITQILPTMSKHRLTPPPEEIYSLHKKVVGTYLMCIKLGAKVPARRIFEDTYENWHRLHRGEPLKPRLDYF
jgi:aarF domain-containing kinase